MHKFKSLIISCLVAGAVLITAPSFATAGTVFTDDANKQLNAAAGSGGANLGNPTDPRVTIIFIIRFALNLIGLILICLNAYAGFLWMTAGGNDEQISQAKGYIRNGVIGLIIVLSAYSLTILAANIARGYMFTPMF